MTEFLGKGEEKPFAKQDFLLEAHLPSPKGIAFDLQWNHSPNFFLVLIDETQLPFWFWKTETSFGPICASDKSLKNIVLVLPLWHLAWWFLTLSPRKSQEIRILTSKSLLTFVIVYDKANNQKSLSHQLTVEVCLGGPFSLLTPPLSLPPFLFPFLLHLLHPVETQ